MVAPTSKWFHPDVQSDSLNEIIIEIVACRANEEYRAVSIICSFGQNLLHRPFNVLTSSKSPLLGFSTLSHMADVIWVVVEAWLCIDDQERCMPWYWNSGRLNCRIFQDRTDSFLKLRQLLLLYLNFQAISDYFPYFLITYYLCFHKDLNSCLCVSPKNPYKYPSESDNT